VPPGPLRFTLLALLYGLPAVATLRPLDDPDIWYHLAYGRWMVEHGALLRQDPFGAYTRGAELVAYSWMFDVLAYGLHALAGAPGLALLPAVATVAAVVVFRRIVRRSDPAFGWEWLLVAAATFSLLPVLGQPRSWLASVLLFGAAFATLLGVRQSGRHRPLIGLPLLFALWANLHLQFVHGLAVVALFAIEPLVARVAGARLEPCATRPVPAVVCLLACAAATSVTPYGTGIYHAVAENARLSAAYDLVRELQAPGFRGVFDWGMLGLLLSAVFRLGRRPLLPGFPAAALTLGTVLAFRARRDVWLLVIPAVALLADLRPARGPGERVALHGWRRGGLVAAVAGLAAAGWMATLGGGRGDATLATAFPAAAADEVARRGYPGPVYAHYNWGSYLLWRLPGRGITMDGRMPLQGERRVTRSLHTWAGASDWARDPELRAANLVIGSPDTALVSLLRRDDGFCLAYEDRVAAVFVSRRMAEARPGACRAPS
jgi:hypothetical protein